VRCCAARERYGPGRSPSLGRLRAGEGGLGELISFQWATAKLDSKVYRVNGQHFSTMLARLNGNFRHNCVVHLDEFEVDSKDGLVNLFRQYDPRKTAARVICCEPNSVATVIYPEN
jgi:hypothetical protein